MIFKILGYIPSKKNRTIIVSKGGKSWGFNAKQKEINDIILQLKSQKKEPTITEDISVEYDIQCRYRRQDRSNIIATCDDALAKAKIIENDKQIIQECSVIKYGIKDPITTISIKKL